MWVLDRRVARVDNYKYREILLFLELEISRLGAHLFALSCAQLVVLAVARRVKASLRETNSVVTSLRRKEGKSSWIALF